MKDFSSAQKRLIKYLATEGECQKGRWVKHFPRWSNGRTLRTLVRDEWVETKATPIPKSKWKRRKNCVGQAVLSFRLKLNFLKTVRLAGFISQA